MQELFRIFKPTTEELKKTASPVNEPHRHNYEELLIIMKGGVEHFIDFKNNVLKAPLISYVSKGKIHRIKFAIEKNSPTLEAWVIRFKSEFVPETTFQLYANYHDYANIELEQGKSFERMVLLCEMMYDETKQPAPDFVVIRNILSTLFIMIESARKKLGAAESGLQLVQNITFKNFLRILEDNFRRPESVELYAEKMNMSVRNLNIICQNILQKSVSEIIEVRKLTEAKNLLINSEKSISEIGFELGYNEKAYFTNVFKKKSGQTPTEFREEMKKLIS